MPGQWYCHTLWEDAWQIPLKTRNPPCSNRRRHFCPKSFFVPRLSRDPLERATFDAFLKGLSPCQTIPSFSISSSIHNFAGRVSIPDTLLQRLSGLDSRQPYREITRFPVIRLTSPSKKPDRALEAHAGACASAHLHYCLFSLLYSWHEHGGRDGFLGSNEAVGSGSSGIEVLMDGQDADIEETRAIERNGYSTSESCMFFALQGFTGSLKTPVSSLSSYVLRGKHCFIGSCLIAKGTISSLIRNDSRFCSWPIEGAMGAGSRAQAISP